jgi:hypothetical protein
MVDDVIGKFLFLQAASAGSSAYLLGRRTVAAHGPFKPLLFVHYH